MLSRAEVAETATNNNKKLLHTAYVVSAEFFFMQCLFDSLYLNALYIRSGG